MKKEEDESIRKQRVKLLINFVCNSIEVQLAWEVALSLSSLLKNNEQSVCEQCLGGYSNRIILLIFFMTEDFKFQKRNSFEQ